jgi:glycosyltransferase involved in cell wall biosynthesis
MKILIYAHAFAPGIGGAEKYVMLLAQGLSEQAASVQVTVATATPANGFDDTTLPFRVVRQPDYFTLWCLVGAADIVQLAGPAFLPLLIALLRRKPVAIEHHGYPPACPNGLLFHTPTQTNCPGYFMARRYGECLRCNAATAGWRSSLMQLVLTFPRRWMCFFVAANCPITDHVQKRLRLPRPHTIYYGIPDPLAGLSADTDEPLAQPLCFAYVGRLTSQKGLPLLIQAASHLLDQGYNFRLMFIGDGAERSRLEHMTETLGLQEQVTFTGFLQGEQLQSTLAEVAAVVMPSIWEETAGLSAIEQMMRGRVVIAANIGGLGEVVSQAGLRFAAGDTKELIACLQRVLDEPELVRILGRAARARALHLFRQERMVNEHVHLYSSLV